MTPTEHKSKVHYLIRIQLCDCKWTEWLEAERIDRHRFWIVAEDRIWHNAVVRRDDGIEVIASEKARSA